MTDPQNAQVEEGDELLDEATGGAVMFGARPSGAQAQGFGDGISVGPGGANPRG